ARFPAEAGAGMLVPRRPPSRSPCALHCSCATPCHYVDAPKLDAINGIVNMSRAIACSDDAGMRTSNEKNIGRDAMGGWFRMLAVAATVVATVGASSAQTGFPAKAVHLFVPYPAGGAVDILARTLGDELSKQWGQPVIIENRPGAGGLVASQALAAAPPDGYTLIVVASGHAT